MIIKKLVEKFTPENIIDTVINQELCFVLESGQGFGEAGRFTFAGDRPVGTFSCTDDRIVIDRDGDITSYRGDVFENLKKFLNEYRHEFKTDIPFLGGAVGYFGYDLCHSIESLPRNAVRDVDIPDCFFGIYDGIYIHDNHDGSTYIAAFGVVEEEDDILFSLWGNLIQKKKQNSEKKKTNKDNINTEQQADKIKSGFTKEEYILAVTSVKNYILEGDIYQANLTQRFSCSIKEKPSDIFRRLRRINPSPFGGYLDFGSGCIICSSPERFLRIQGDKIETRPIKGTIKRGKTPEEDQLLKSKLYNSEKDRAELLMIVDLERNDLGRIAVPGTVRVKRLFNIEEYPTLFHLVSIITAKIEPGNDVISCIRAAFPGGSITGAPKIRAMEIIDELEPTQRNIYTGSFGYIGFNGDCDLNIIIRTILCKDDTAYFQVGGGIVWDSDPEKEYEETMLKGKALFKSLKSN